MKKLFYLLIAAVLLLPNIAKADMGAPMVAEYKASVTNPDGVYVYVYDSKQEKYVKTDKIIPYGTVIKVYEEYEIEKAGIIDVKNSLVKDGEKNVTYYVYIKDLTLTNDKYEVNLNDLGGESEAYTLKNLEIKKGPAASYGSTNTTIKAGSTIKVRSLMSYETPWYYVEYNGVKGFVDTYESVVFSFEQRDLITSMDVKLYDVNTRKEVKTIKSGTKLKAKLGFSDRWNSYAYIEYEGTRYYTSDTGYITKYSSQFRTVKEVKVYKEVGDEKEIATIPANTIISSEYSEQGEGDYLIYYENGNIKGWIQCIVSEEDEILEKNESKKFKANTNLNIYEEANKNAKVVGTLTTNTVFESEYYNSVDLVYYDKDGVKGWIINGEATMIDKTKSFKTTKEVDVYDSLGSNKKSIGKVNANTDFTSEYYYYGLVYYEKDNLKGWISYKNEVISKDDDEDRIKNYILSKAMNLYETIDKQKVVTTLPASTKFTNDYDGDSIYYYEKDGVKGYIVLDDDKVNDATIYERDEIEVILKTDVKLYEESSSTKVVTILKSGTTFKTTYYNDHNPGLIYYENDDIKGWISYSYGDVLEDESDDEVIVIGSTDDKKEVVVDDKKDDNKKDDNKKEVKPKKDNTLFICIGIAVILSLTTIVTIVLINKKKKASV